MIQFISISLAAGFSFLVTLADSRLKLKEGADPFGDTQEYFEKHIKPLVAGIGRAKTVTLYEGLPHQRRAGDLLARELKEKKTVRLNGFPYYAAPITPDEATAKKLAVVCGDLKSFGPFGGPKRCGGYHPDWCIEFKDGDDVYRLYICFGCDEVVITGPTDWMVSDLDEKAVKTLSENLPWFTNRPKPERQKSPDPQKKTPAEPDRSDR